MMLRVRRASRASGVVSRAILFCWLFLALSSRSICIHMQSWRCGGRRHALRPWGTTCESVGGGRRTCETPVVRDEQWVEVTM